MSNIVNLSHSLAKESMYTVTQMLKETAGTKVTDSQPQSIWDWKPRKPIAATQGSKRRMEMHWIKNAMPIFRSGDYCCHSFLVSPAVLFTSKLREDAEALFWMSRKGVGSLHRSINSSYSVRCHETNWIFYNNGEEFSRLYYFGKRFFHWLDTQK